MRRYVHLLLALFILGTALWPARAWTQQRFEASFDSPIIQDLRAVQVGESVQLDWFIPQGLSCIDMQVQRIGPTSPFRTQHTVFGICGSDDSDSFYDFTDTDPLLPNQTYGWRIYASNGTVVSDTVYLNYIGTSNTLQVGPNPLTGTGYAWFNNASGERVRLEWWDASGKLLRQSAFSVQQRFPLQRGALQSGTYLLVLRQETGLVLSSAVLQVL